MKVQYTGTADVQEFSAADFKKAGIEDAGKVRFPQGVPVEVEDAVGEALVSKEGLFGGHKFQVFEEEGDVEAELTEMKNKNDGDGPDPEDTTESGRVSTTDTATAGGTTGRGRRGGTTRA